MRFLAPCSIVLFGSCIERTSFVIDTVFVVGRDAVDHTLEDWDEVLDGQVSDTYRTATLEPWYLGNVPDGQSHRLYFAAMFDHPIDSTFSFFPCRPFDRGEAGFARPIIDIPGYVTPTLTQGKKVARNLGSGELTELWREVVKQVDSQNLLLGVRAEMPSTVGLSDLGSDADTSQRPSC